MKEIHFKALSVIAFIFVLFTLFGMASTSTKGGALYEYTNTPKKVETRAHKRAVKQWERATKNRQWRVDHYPNWLITMQDRSHPVGDKP